MPSAGFKPHPDADVRRTSARKALAGILALDLYPAHKRELLSICLWKVTEADGRSKHRTRFRSVASLTADPNQLHHEHVYRRAKMVEALLAAPHDVDAIVEKAVGCTVTRAEHRRLGEVDREEPDLDGWERYGKAGIQVLDTLTGASLGAP